MNCQSPTKADWAGFNEFLLEEFSQHSYRLIDSRGNQLAQALLSDREAANWNNHLRDDNQDSRWMRSAPEDRVPVPPLKPVRSRRRYWIASAVAFAIALAVAYWWWKC